MSRTLLSLAGFQVIVIGRFWVIAEDLEIAPFLFWRAISLLVMEDTFPPSLNGKFQTLIQRPWQGSKAAVHVKLTYMGSESSTELLKHADVSISLKGSHCFGTSVLNLKQ
jgi:hypothetical protein